MKNDHPLIIGIGEVLWDLLPEGKRCGGAPANVVYHLTRQGMSAAVVSAVGNDTLGDELIEFLCSKGLAIDYIARNELPTGTVGVTLKDGIPSYEIHHPAAWDAITLPEELQSNLSRVSAVIWGTLAQRSPVSRETIRKILEAVPEDALKCFDINLRQNYYCREVIESSLEFANVLKINEEEVTVTAKLLAIAGNRETVLRELFRRYRLNGIICTLGAGGSMLFDGSTFTRYPVKKCQVVDTVGCGDAFLAGWCGAVLNGRSAAEGMFSGTELAAAIAQHPGAM